MLPKCIQTGLISRAFSLFSPESDADFISGMFLMVPYCTRTGTLPGRKTLH